MKYILLSQGLSAMVDDDDFENLNKHKWYAHKDHNTFYACRHIYRGIKRVVISMHQEVLFFPPSKIDHKDRNGLNNQKNNLRLCTHSQNMVNKKLQKNNKTGYRGVSFNKNNKKYKAAVYQNGKEIFLGWFVSPEMAAQVYDAAAKVFYGDFFICNFSDYREIMPVQESRSPEKTMATIEQFRADAEKIKKLLTFIVFCGIFKR